MSIKNNNFSNNKRLEGSIKNTAKNSCSVLENNEYKKTEIIKDDGRYLIYYDFKKNENKFN
ncbi:MAG: hypothetical protein M1479_01605 [Actinobacteria bacterium]|nr:hypothetical protein [Actinomycetota bacterium]